MRLAQGPPLTDNPFMNATIADFSAAVDHLPEGATLLVRDVLWEDYEALLEAIAERPGIRVTYDRGKLEIMSPLPDHEECKRFIERMVDALGDHLDLNLEPRGSATWKRERDARGTEPDTCYYVANAERIIGKRKIDLSIDPPPDIAVEIDATNESLAKLPIYATLRVPEIWRYEVRNNRFHMYELHGQDYVEMSSSRSFPVMTASAFAEFIEHSKTRGQKAAMAAFRDWLKKQ
jgi:Uma2 family endonuclease